MRRPGDWYVSSDLCILDNGCIVGKYGNGQSPDEAVRNHWEIYSNVEYPNVVFNSDTSKKYLWNKYVWKEVT